jgi:Gpi18-like mannosyltransferase
MIKTATIEGMRYYPRAYMAYFSVFLIFISSRLIILLAIDFSSRFISQNSGSMYWNISRSWYGHLLRYDSGWYLRIMSEGYTYDDNVLTEHPVVFHPFYPLVSRVISAVLSVKPAIAILIVSNISILVAILLLFKLAREEYGEETALYAVAFISFFPTSLFFSAGYTESLTLSLIVISFLFLRRGQYLLASCCAGLALATRSTGIVLIPPILFELWRQFSGNGRSLAKDVFICTILATSGLWLYMIYLWIAFNKPLAFITAQRAWLNGNEVGSNVFDLVTLRPFLNLRDIFQVGPQPSALDPWFFLSFMLILIFFGKKLSISYRLFAFGALLLPYFTLTGGLGFRSFTRYLLLAFPVFIVMANIFRRSSWFCLCLTAFFAAMLFMYSALFAQWYWAG